MDFSAKDAVQLLMQAGFAGLCVLMVNVIGKKLDALSNRIVDLTLSIVDHKARNGDTPGSLRKP